MLRFLRLLPKTNLILVDEHHHILDHLNSARCSDICHVDFHQDIAYPTKDMPEVELDCGSFFYYVKDRTNVNYTWFYPDASCAKGAQHGLCMPREAKPFAKSNLIFGSQRMRLGLPNLKGLNVCGVGVAVSTLYLEDNNVISPLLKEAFTILGVKP